MKKRMLYIIVAAVVIVFTAGIMFLSNPLRKTEERTRLDMLRLTPIGTSMEDVLALIESKSNWEIAHNGRIWDKGYAMVNGRPSGPYGDTPRVGVKSMEVYIGSFWFVFKHTVAVFYGFDDDSKLVDIAVLHYVDGI